MIWLLLVLNFAISWFNAWSVGHSWAESRHEGGIAHFMNWCGAIMSASGFTWCYLLIVGTVCNAIPIEVKAHPGTYMPLLPDAYLQGFYALGYLTIILPIIGSGIAITIQSWAIFYRRRTFLNGAVASYNTFADIYNVVSAFRNVPEAFSIVGNLFGGSRDNDSDSDSDDLKGKLLVLMVVLVILCVVGGILTTAAIIRSTARGLVYTRQMEFEAAGGQIPSSRGRRRT